jgi:adenosylmethionine-8-amino-7-oxononanoate aminotransferase
MEARHKTFMNKHIKDHPRLIQQRVCGTIFAAEIQSKEEDSYFNSVAPILKKRFIEKGFLIRPLGNTVYLMPPYCIDDDILEAAYKVIAKCCASI